MASSSIGWNILHPFKLGSLALLAILACPFVVLAQIRPDSTLGNEQSRVINRDLRGGNATVIEGGAERSTNLFHSFQDFNVNDGERVYFANPSGVENIFSRVTGTDRSTIRGTLGVDGAANLFLLNPNGILFGPNASLDLRGSFLATTADRITFLDGSQFSAVNPEAAPLLTVSVPVGLQFGNNPREITNRSTSQVLDAAGNPLLDPNGDPAIGLRVLPNQTLAFVGGTIRLIGGGLVAGGDATAPGGRIELGSVADSGLVSLTPIASGWQLGYEDATNLGTIQLAQLASVNASGASGGAIQVQARQIKLNDGSGIFSVTQGAQPGSSLTLNALESISLTGQSFVVTQTRSDANAGNLRINTPQLTIREQNGVSANQSQIGSLTQGNGRGGDVSIHAAESVIIDNGVLLAQTCPLMEECGSGAAGRLNVTTNYLRVLEGGQINTTTWGAGRSGNVTIQARTVEVAGIQRLANGEPFIDPISDLPYPSGIFAGTNPGSSGNGGRLTLKTQQLNLSDGAVLFTATLGSGDAGDLVVNARESIDISGVSAGRRFPTSLIAISGGLPGSIFGAVSDATGRGGNLTITTEDLTVRDEAVIAVSSVNPAGRGAGRIQIDAQHIQLDNGQINARTESGSGANIRLNNVDLLLLRRNSQITTSAGLEGGGGTGGDINVLRAGFIVASPSENSDITANAVRENAGNVEINERGIAGITPQNRQTAQSDITATSTLANSGVIRTTSTVIDPTRGVVTLPSNFVDASQLIAQGCAPREGDVSRFVATGRGGLPLSPDQPLQERSPLTPEWVTLNSETENAVSQDAVSQDAVSQEIEHKETHSSGENAIEPLRTTQPEIVEASGWMIDANGKVALIAQTHSADSIRSHLQGDCLSH